MSYAELDDSTGGISAFLEGLLGLEPSAPVADPDAYDPLYRRTAFGDLEVKRPLDPLNGEAILRPLASHVYVVRLDVSTEDREEVERGLVKLGELLTGFLEGKGREHYDPLEEKDRRGHGALALIGFGPGFFVRGDGKPRFGIDEAAMPARLAPLKLLGDEAHGHDAAASQTDLLIVIEANNRSLVIEAAGDLLAHAEASDWLAVRDDVEGARREDGRNALGFPRGLANATVESDPTGDEVALCTSADEAPALVRGSYLAYRRYAVDLGEWRALSVDRQERLVGLTKESGERLVPMPADALWARVIGHGAPPLVRRSSDVAELHADNSLEHGLLYLFAQRRPDEQLAVLHDRVLAPTEPDGAAILAGEMVRPRASGLYFAPHATFTEYPGQQLLHPDLVARFLEGLAHFAACEYESALEAYRDVERDRPTFVWAYAAASEVYHDLQLLDDAAAVLARAAKVAPDNHLYLEQQGWQHYLEGDYARAAETSQRAIRAYYDDSYRSYPYHDLAAALLQAGALAEAERAARRAVVRVNLVTKNCFTLGNTLEAQGRLTEARTIYDRTVEVAEYLLERGRVSPRDARTQLDLAFIRYRSDRATETIDRVVTLIDRYLPPGPPDARASAR